MRNKMSGKANVFVNALVLILICMSSVLFAGQTVKQEAKILWEKEIVFEPNSSSQPLALVADDKNNEVILLGTSIHSNPKEDNNWLWIMDTDGNIKKKQSLGRASKFEGMARALGAKAMLRLDDGTILKFNVSDESEPSRASITTIDKNFQSSTAKMFSWTRGVKIRDWTALKNDKLIFVGQSPDSNGIVLETDLAGKMIWQKTFDKGQTEILSSIAISPDGNDFYVTATSVSLVDQTRLPDPPTVYVLMYDKNGEFKKSDSFEGGYSALLGITPKVICLPSGTVIVIYDNTKKGVSTGLYLKAYTPELKTIIEKQILITKEKSPPNLFDICTTEKNHFVLAAEVNGLDLSVFECDSDGAILQTLERKRTIGGGGRVFANYLAGKIFLTFASALKDNERDNKIKLLAIKPY